MMVAENCEGVPYSAWGVSLGVHALIVGLAFMITAQVQPILKEEIFQWEVALIQPSPDSPQTETPQSTPAVQPSKPTPVRTVQTVQPVQPVEPTSDMVMTRVATPYSPEVVHPMIPPPTPAPVQEAKKEEIKKEEVKPQDVVKPEPVQEIVQAQIQPAPIAREVSPPVEPVATAQAYEPPAPSRAHHAESAPVIHHESPSPDEAAPEWRPLAAVREGSAKAMSAPAAASAAQAAAESTVVAAAAPVRAPAHHPDAPMVASTAPVRPATKADNAWLAESLGRRIKELTRYPSSARLNGSEGKVVLRVVLRADGHLVDVVVHRSSGHEVLDRAAMETVRLACPIHMKQALSAAEVAVYVPIVYSLAG
ncbi:MAG: TonB family protein [Nitrospira sp.]